MNVFVLCTGRCGSTTFIKACRHIRNYTCAHESRTGLPGAARMHYPENHIEADNRLAWFLGRLDQDFGDDAFYVHLRRNKLRTAQSFTKRYDFGIISAYAKTILPNAASTQDPLAVCLDYCHTVNANIESFLRTKSHTMPFALEHARQDFRTFWDRIGAEGNLPTALDEWETAYNRSFTAEALFNVHALLKYGRKTRRIIRRLPTFIRNA